MTAHLDDLFVLSDRELATVLYGLRLAQGADINELDDFFDEHDQLTDDEIDDLCERLNTEPTKGK